MNIVIEKGSLQQLDDCEEALRQSVLGEKYFSAAGSARNAVLEAIGQDRLYVALDGENCVGFFYVIPKGAFHAFPYLHLIAVKEEYRGRGIGKLLLRGAEQAAFETADKLFLVVADFNPDAERLYRECGYRRVGELPGLYRPGITEYLMMKEKI